MGILQASNSSSPSNRSRIFSHPAVSAPGPACLCLEIPGGVGWQRPLSTWGEGCIFAAWDPLGHLRHLTDLHSNVTTPYTSGWGFFSDCKTRFSLRKDSLWAFDPSGYFLKFSLLRNISIRDKGKVGEYLMFAAKDKADGRVQSEVCPKRPLKGSGLPMS